MPLCFELILGMTVNSVQGNKVYLEWIGMVARLLEFLSAFKLRLPPLVVRWKAGIPFPMKQGNGPSSRDEEGKTGLFLSCGGTLGVPL